MDMRWGDTNFKCSWDRDRALGHALPMVEHSSLDKSQFELESLGKYTYGKILFPDSFSIDQRNKTFIDFGLV